MISFNSVSKHYGARKALDNIDFSLKQGELAFLTGHSGAGKSTLLKMIALIERPDEGVVTVNGVAVKELNRRQVPYMRRQIGLIFQDHQLLDDRTVHQNVALPLIIAGCKPDKIPNLVKNALAAVGLAGRADEYPRNLSTGEQQRVGIARAVVNQPKILLADEPTGNLDPELSMEILQLFVNFHRAGTAVLIATHDLDLVANMKRRVITLEGGQLIQDIPAVNPSSYQDDFDRELAFGESDV